MFQEFLENKRTNTGGISEDLKQKFEDLRSTPVRTKRKVRVWYSASCGCGSNYDVEVEREVDADSELRDGDRISKLQDGDRPLNPF